MASTSVSTSARLGNGAVGTQPAAHILPCFLESVFRGVTRVGCMQLA